MSTEFYISSFKDFNFSMAVCGRLRGISTLMCINKLPLVLALITGRPSPLQLNTVLGCVPGGILIVKFLPSRVFISI